MTYLLHYLHKDLSTRLVTAYAKMPHVMANCFSSMRQEAKYIFMGLVWKSVNLLLSFRGHYNSHFLNSSTVLPIFCPEISSHAVIIYIDLEIDGIKLIYWACTMCQILCKLFSQSFLLNPQNNSANIVILTSLFINLQNWHL